MLRFGSVRWLSALLLVGLMGTVAYAASITGSVTTTPLMGTSVSAYTSGTYTLAAGEVGMKIEAVYYTIDKNGNLTFAASNTDPNYAGGNYKTQPFVLTKGTMYKVITSLYYTDINKNNKDTGWSTTFTP